MKHQTKTFFEHQKKTYDEIGWKPDDPRINQLEQLVLDAGIPIFTIGRHSIKAGQYVGVVRLASQTLQILPKIDYEGYFDASSSGDIRTKSEQSATRNLLTMLSYTHNIQLQARSLTALRDQPSDWFELLTRLFASELHSQMLSGVEHQYVQCEDNLAVIRGRWQISHQLAVHPHLHHRFDVCYDDFSPDTALNQVFKFVAHRLLQMTADTQNRRYLQDISDWLDEVTPYRAPIQTLLPRIRFNRLNERFRPTYNLARLFLENLVIQLTAGLEESFAFVLDMNRLFEEFIGKFITHHWKHIWNNLSPEVKIVLQSQGKRIFLADYLLPASGQAFQLIPDIQLTDDHRRVLLVADTKYKRLTDARPHFGVVETDLYQMLAYAIRLDCPRLLLLYPQADSTPIRAVMKIQDQSQTVMIATLNLHIPLENPGNLNEELRLVLNQLLT